LRQVCSLLAEHALRSNIRTLFQHLITPVPRAFLEAPSSDTSP
jgi:hypothetical protein